MCLSMPSKVLSTDGESAEVDFMGVKKTIGVTLIENVKVGDYLLVHSGFAIERISEEEALETLKIWEEINAAIGQSLYLLCVLAHRFNYKFEKYDI